ncbi:lipopolysaccharide assembly protein LapB [Siphonobacter sp. SORGH_AS_1065]|uniref:tetratricopeptide repeat protein n=1 Tax=Siphonobacter sp. SORGH_AS_1065 TaxID=3041795 RepID=UPI002784908D|nr:hypothetical protein [Siphonobacter sp. SORGH_AS_1065]MDQ1087947.1 Flp pilus assembly protein TadD [Siphonobacter sp. SORGH_AS_1065]
MQAAIFWSAWPRPYQRLFYIGLFGFVVGLIAWAFFAYQGVDSVIHWDVLSELGEMPFGLDQFEANGSKFQIQARAYALTEQFVASPMSVNHPLTDWVCLILALVGVAITLMATSALPRLWYFGAMTAFILLTSSLQIDAILGRTDRLATIILVTVFVGVSFYFQAFKRDAGLLIRFIVFKVLIVVSVALLCTVGKATPADLLAYGYPAGMVLVILVAFWVSFEIMIGLTWLATNQSGRNSLPSFTVLSLFYLGNLLLTDLHTSRRIDWDLLYLNPFVVFTISIILGLWGQKKRDDQRASYWSFQPQGASLYLGLVTIAVSVLAYVNSTANDSAIESLSQGINYAHLTGGVLFFFYVLLNFGPQMREGKPVHIVLFKPAYIASFHARGLSVILCMVLMYYNNYYVFQQGVAGYYNTQGDLAAARQDYRLAETFYQQGAEFDFQNHKSNYGLASLAWIQGDFASAAGFFRQAVAKNPSPYAYAGLTRSLTNEELAFDAFFTARDGQKRFPNNGELMSNLAYLHAKANGLDSAQYYYAKAIELTRQAGVPATNLMALYLRKGDLPAAEKLASEQASDYVSVQVNQKAVELLNGKSSETKISIGADSVLTLAQFALVSNATLSDIKAGKTPPVTGSALRTLSEKEGNAAYFDDLQYLHALVSYYDGNKLEGLDILSARAMADTAASGDRWRKPLAAFLNREVANEQAPPTRWTGDGSEELMRNPLNIKVLERYTAEANQRKEPQKAYNALYNALNYRQDSPEILKLYILQSLELSLTQYAEEKLKILQNDFPGQYESFLPVYQQKRALIEKRQQDFQ